MNRQLKQRLARLEEAMRPPAPGTRYAPAADEGHAERIWRAHLASGDPRELVVVITGVPRDPEEL